MTKQEIDAMFSAMDDDKKGSKKFWNVDKDKEGTYPIRLLPPLSKKGEVKFYFKHFVHWVNGKPFECLDQSLVDKDGNHHDASICPICSFVNKLYRGSERDSDEWKLAGELKKRERYVSRIIVRGKDPETEPEFYEYGPTVYNILYHIIRETDFGNIIDPKEGRDFNLAKRGLRRQAKYDTSTPSAKQTPIFDDVQKLKAVLENAMKMDFNSLIEFRTSNEMQNAIDEYLGMEKPTSDDDEPEVEEKRTEKPAEKPAVVKQKTQEEDEVDSILSEFAGF
jgi:hypothetical protein